MRDEAYSFQEWQPCYSVGNSLLDGQHKKLLLLCSQAIQLAGQDHNAPSLQLQNVLGELWGNLKVHFRTEEALLAECSYSLLNEHKQEHQMFQLVFSELLHSVTAGDYKKETLIGYLSDWWPEHILCSDKQYVLSIQSLKSAGEPKENT